MVKQEIFHTTITKDFSEIWGKFNKIIDKDNEFRYIVRQKEKIDKRIKKGRDASAKIRFAISFYVREKRKQEINKMREENDKTESGNIKED
ncbi:MAG: hypothetical protein ACOCV1_00010 [Bacillota bacterium]